MQFLPYRSQCTCACHTNPGMLHFAPCCEPDPVSPKSINMDIQQPTPGRIVLYNINSFDGRDQDLQTNNNTVVTGIVTQTFGSLMANLTLFPPMAPTLVVKGSVRHASEAIRWDNNGIPVGCWVYATDNFERYKKEPQADLAQGPGSGL